MHTFVFGTLFDDAFHLLCNNQVVKLLLGVNLGSVVLVKYFSM